MHNFKQVVMPASVYCVVDATYAEFAMILEKGVSVPVYYFIFKFFGKFKNNV